MFLFLKKEKSFKPSKICAILILQCIKVFNTEIEKKKHIRPHKDKEFLCFLFCFFRCKAHYIISTICGWFLQYCCTHIWSHVQPVLKVTDTLPHRNQHHNLDVMLDSRVRCRGVTIVLCMKKKSLKKPYPSCLQWIYFFFFSTQCGLVTWNIPHKNTSILYLDIGNVNYWMVVNTNIFGTFQVCQSYSYLKSINKQNKKKTTFDRNFVSQVIIVFVYFINGFFL